MVLLCQFPDVIFPILGFYEEVAMSFSIYNVEVGVDVEVGG